MRTFFHRLIRKSLKLMTIVNGKIGVEIKRKMTFSTCREKSERFAGTLRMYPMIIYDVPNWAIAIWVMGRFHFPAWLKSCGMGVQVE
jgi:hypothetical protein